MKSVKFLYFSQNAWGNLGRRKIRLAYEFASRFEVASLLFVEPPIQTSFLDVMRGRFLPSHLAQNRRAHLNALVGRPRHRDGKVWVYTGSQKSIPLTRVAAIRRVTMLGRINQALYVQGIRRQLRRLPGNQLVVWTNHPLQVAALDAFPERELACFDWTDDWLQFAILPVADPTELEKANERILRQTDLVFTVSESLYRRASEVNPNTHRAPNATDFVLMAQSSDAGLPIIPDLQTIPRPRLGYIGQLGENVDFCLIREVAAARPDWSMVFVGQVWPNKEEEVARTAYLSNVYFLGGRPHSDLPGFLRGFDVCIMPHLRNALTASMDPTKLYDYLASGKPIVSTSVAGTERFLDVLYIGDSPADFISNTEMALRENGTLQKARLDYAQRNSWPQRAREMWETLCLA